MNINVARLVSVGVNASFAATRLVHKMCKHLQDIFPWAYSSHVFD